MRLMRWLGVGSSWALIVALVAGGAWVAINSAGRQVAARTVIAAPSDDDAIAGSASPTPGPLSATGPPSGSPPLPGSAGGESRPSSTAREGHSARPGKSGSGDRSPGSGSSTQPVPLPVSPPTSLSVPVAGTVNTTAGSMWVECVGASIGSAYAFPAEDWSGDLVRVVDGRADTSFWRSSHTVGVFAVCDSGRPRFEVRSHGDHDGHDGEHHDD